MMRKSTTCIKDQKSLFSETLGAMTKKILEESKHLFLTKNIVAVYFSKLCL